MTIPGPARGVYGVRQPKKQRCDGQKRSMHNNLREFGEFPPFLNQTCYKELSRAPLSLHEGLLAAAQP
jgi:hypothetical protein